MDPNSEVARGEAYRWVSREEGNKTQVASSSVSKRPLALLKLHEFIPP